MPSIKETRMKRPAALFLLALLCLVAAACQPQPPICPPNSTTFQNSSTPFPTLFPSNSMELPEPSVVEMGGKKVLVDEIVHGPLCNAAWHGTVYVACDVQVAQWEGEPSFLKGCDFSVAPGTIVYVAAHNNTAYYNGCSCHTGEEIAP
jgi:hypothetical protein